MLLLAVAMRHKDPNVVKALELAATGVDPLQAWKDCSEPTTWGNFLRHWKTYQEEMPLATAKWTRLGVAAAGGVELAWRSPTAMLGWVEPLRRHGGASPVLFRPLMGELACIVFLDWVTYHMW